MCLPERSTSLAQRVVYRITMLTEAADKARAAADMTPKVDLDEHDGASRIILSGRWVSQSVNHVDAQMRGLEKHEYIQPVSIDVTQISGLDTAGAWLIERLRSRLMQQNIETRLEGVRSAWLPLMDEVGKSVERTLDVPKLQQPFLITSMLEAIGRGVFSAVDDFKMAMHILGATIRGAQLKADRGSGIPIPAIV